MVTTRAVAGITGGGEAASGASEHRTVSEAYALHTATLPFSALNTATTTTRTEGTATRTLKTTRSFDAWGNITAEISHGRTDKDGDEVLVATDYTVNTAEYIMSLPHLQRTYAGTDLTGTLLKQTQFFYDGQAYRTAPSNGSLTTRRDDTTTSSYQTSTFDYDTYGNRLAATVSGDETTSWSRRRPRRIHSIGTTLATGRRWTNPTTPACFTARSRPIPT
ncbi:hypothetical protein [Sinorhizobium saheli]|uniref:Uncharacterized protein n=1 Tax=Sinorhizobium saheli TaxID=36856 RepID=A0A178YRP1_SINSA|nr:hypothetical protein [Sinorhizobium saheli]OAP50228.1 hypothetical protein ATB98_12460 [Sinorhizobium saheli]